jgi:hypothetical protein
MKICIHMEEVKSLSCKQTSESLGLAPDIILTILFCKVNIILLLDELPVHIS